MQQLHVRWGTERFSITIPISSTIAELKAHLEALTDVEAATQKLLGLAPGKIPPDATRLEQLQLKQPHTVTLVGTKRKLAEEIRNEEATLRFLKQEEEAREAELRRIEEERMLATLARQQKEEEERQRRQREEAERRQREWEEQRRIQREQMLAEERRLEMESSAQLEFDIACYSSAVAAVESLELSNKILLPPDILQTIVDRRLALPIIFKIGSPRSVEISHVGVRDFTAPAGKAYLPYWVMKKLGLEEGDTCHLHSVQLPSAKHIQLQPHSASWVELPAATREAVLDLQLRNFQSATPGDVITLEYNSVQYSFDVVSVVPGPSSDPNSSAMDIDTTEYRGGVSLIDAEVSVDVLPPIEQARSPNILTLAPSPLSLATGSAPILGSSPSRPLPTATSSSPTRTALKAGEYARFILPLPSPLPTHGIAIHIKPISGDPVLYASTTHTKPSRSLYQWCDQRRGEKTLSISTQELSSAIADATIASNALHIAVYAWKSDIEFEISTRMADEKEFQGTALGTSAPTGSADDGAVCSNCHRRVPATALVLHMAQCEKLNYCCGMCGQVMSMEERIRHHEMVHTPISCDDCGKALEQPLLVLHRQHECPRRLVRCIYCPLMVPQEQRGEHQGSCGSKSAKCVHCKRHFKRKEVKRHLVEEHGIYPQNVSDQDYVNV